MFIDALNAVDQLQYQEKDIQRYVPYIVQNSFNPGAPRAVKLVAYNLICNFSSTCSLDWQSVIGTIFSDIDTQDAELQNNAFRTIN